jgi:hypothetical protein
MRSISYTCTDIPLPLATLVARLALGQFAEFFLAVPISESSGLGPVDCTCQILLLPLVWQAHWPTTP